MSCDNASGVVLTYCVRFLVNATWAYLTHTSTSLRVRREFFPTPGHLHHLQDDKTTDGSPTRDKNDGMDRVLSPAFDKALDATPDSDTHGLCDVIATSPTTS